jgi:diguanylate cyclase (GGDEF)-like protein
VRPDEQERDIAGVEETLADAEQNSADVDQILSDSDQTGSEHDQISSDRDQAAADIDQAAADIDQAAADIDQAAADIDQAAADIDQAAGDATRVQRGDPLAYERTRRMRADSTLERHTASRVRGTSSVVRDRIAAQRDRVAAARDLTSAARDEVAAALDTEAERLEREHGAKQNGRLDDRGVQLRAGGEGRLAAQSRARAALQRRAAAEDREHAARDRQFAAFDREAYAQELTTAATDEVTGALRRGVGLAALQRELDRTRRTGEPLIVAFVDVDGLKAVNDDRGHAAGDALLRTVARLIGDEFRSYDLILRFGGDEFVCSFSGAGLADIGKRFERVGAHLTEAIPGASISIGVSKRRPADTIKTLLDRADTTMIATRRECSRQVAEMGRAGKASVPADAERLHRVVD